jgi:hypothetical protein
MHGAAREIEGGQQITVAPEPNIGAEWCGYYGIDPVKADFVVPNIDRAILDAIRNNVAAGLEMGGWHGTDCDETNWCGTTHCRAGYAISLAGKAGFALEKKYGAEIAGKMIYAASRPDQPLPDFYGSNESAIADLEESAALDQANG